MDQYPKALSRRTTLTSSLLQASSIWKRAAEKALVDDGISVARANLLLWVGRMGGGVRQVHLAECLGLASQSMVRLLDELTASGHVERREDASDRRAKTIWLTPEGLALANRVELVLSSLREHVLGDIGKDDIEAAHRVFDAIVARSGLA